MEQTLDKYYTKIDCVKHIVDITLKFFSNTNLFVEPSAGSGNISHYIASLGYSVISYDIMPEAPDIIKADYLTTAITKETHITIGNPPFGYKGKLAVVFLNKALKESLAVAFIMPITAGKYSCQKNILQNAKLIYSESLPSESFELPNKQSYSCPSMFQIWSLFSNEPDLRISKPKISCEDFMLYRHNATPSSRKYLNYDWDFAVYAQGRKDYKKIFFPIDYNFLKQRMNETSDQFYFFKAKNKNILNTLLKIDFEKLAYTGHITPGFCKNDIIQHYETLCKGDKYA